MLIRLGHAVVLPDRPDVSGSEMQKLKDATTFDLRATKTWTGLKKENIQMAETYVVHIAENGYVIHRQGYAGDTSGDMQIASDGELEEQLKIFRVKQRLAPNIAAGSAAAPAPTRMPLDVKLMLKNSYLKGQLPVPASPTDKLTFMGHVVSEQDLKDALRL